MGRQGGPPWGGGDPPSKLDGALNKIFKTGGWIRREEREPRLAV